MKKIFNFTFIILAVTMLFSGCSAENSQKQFDRDQVAELLGGIYESSEIRWKDNSIVELRSVFKDTDYALKKIHEEAGGLITKLRFMYFLPKLTAENYEKYDAALWDYRLDKYGIPASVPYEVSALEWCISVLHNRDSNEIYIKMNGMDDSAEETFELLGEDKLSKIKLLTSDLLEYLAESSNIEMLCEENLDDYKKTLESVDSTTIEKYKFEYELLALFVNSNSNIT